MERETGIEPALVAWKATVLPLNYSRPGVLQTVQINQKKSNETLVEGGGLLRASCPPPLRGQPSAVQNRSRRFCRTKFSFRWFQSTSKRCPMFKLGGGRWIRTTEGMSQQIYSLPPLAAWVSLRICLCRPKLRIRFRGTVLRQLPTRLHGGGGDRAGYCPVQCLSLSRRHG